MCGKTQQSDAHLAREERTLEEKAGVEKERLCHRATGKWAPLERNAGKEERVQKVYNDAFEQSSSVRCGCTRANPTWG
jgi:hypothetical protein